MSAKKTVLRLITVQEFKPFVHSGRDGAGGIDVEIVNEMCRRMDIECQLSFHPWVRVLALIESGAFDGGFTGFKTSERMAYAHFVSPPLHYSTYSLFVKNGECFNFNGIEDLHGKTIGIHRGLKINPELHAAVDKGLVEIQEVDSLEINIRKLMAGRRIDAVAANYHKMKLKLLEMALNHQVVCLPRPITPPEPSYLMMSRKWTPPGKENMLKEMSRTLQGMYDDGTIDKINRSYLD